MAVQQNMTGTTLLLTAAQTGSGQTQTMSQCTYDIATLFSLPSNRLSVDAGFDLFC
jgi:hypothetical protein